MQGGITFLPRRSVSSLCTSFTLDQSLDDLYTVDDGSLSLQPADRSVYIYTHIHRFGRARGGKKKNVGASIYCIAGITFRNQDDPTMHGIVRGHKLNANVHRKMTDAAPWLPTIGGGGGGSLAIEDNIWTVCSRCDSLPPACTALLLN